MCVQYRGGRSAEYRGGVQYRGDIMSTVGDILSTVGVFRGGYHDKCGGYLEYRGVFSTVGDIMSTVGVILSTVGCSVPWGIS